MKIWHKRTELAIACGLVGIVAGCQTIGPQTAAPSLSAEDIGRLLTVSQGAGRTTVSSQGAVGSDRTVLSTVGSNAFLLAEIGSGPDDIQYLVVFTEARQTAEWPTPVRARFGDPQQTAEVDRIDTNLDCSGATGGDRDDCLRMETAAFEVPASELEAATAGGADKWEFRVKNQASHDLTESLPVNEILAVMDRAQELAGDRENQEN
ncbi:MAG: hypothetical protein O7A03_01660 [Alphaproteobacteria bacterium]|nr:hypothetical protein [Alphaproteobacteria bacterium]